MKTIVLITGDTRTFGHGHQVRMHNLALELKRRQLTTMHIVAAAEDKLSLPLKAGVVVLDRRDTGFNEFAQPESCVKLALDNRGPARAHADIVIDALPHLAMNAAEYRLALSHVMLPALLTKYPPQTQHAKVTLHQTQEAACEHADFKATSGVLSPGEYLAAMQNSSKPALYFGQGLFEALYAGKHVQLYPVSDYHMQLAEDFVARLSQSPDLLTALDGLGLNRVADRVQSAHKQIQEKP